MEFVVDLSLKNALKPELVALNKNLENLAGQSDGFLGDLLHYVLIGSGTSAFARTATQQGLPPLKLVFAEDRSVAWMDKITAESWDDDRRLDAEALGGALAKRPSLTVARLRQFLQGVGGKIIAIAMTFDR